MATHVLTAEQTAARLGVKLSTVYAYVSRGLLTRTLAEDGRTSRFDAAEVERIALRGRPRKDSRPLGGIDVSLATAITSIQGGRLYYRGHDATGLAGCASFETVAELLWTGELPERPTWPGSLLTPAKLRGLAAPAGSWPLEQLAVVTAHLACSQPLRVDLRPVSVTQHARALLASFVEAVGFFRVGDEPRRSEGLAARLWPRLSPQPATPARVALLNATLILLADHELATSTLAARIAASTRADPFAVVLAGLGALSGPLHGKAALGAHEVLLDAAQSAAPERAIGRAIATRGHVPGFGHVVYHDADPRAECLQARLGALAGRSERRLIDALVAAGAAASGKQPNIDFSLAACAYATGMPLGATEAIFAIARSAGWIAHALEEYGEQPLRFRARAIYIGRRPLPGPT